MREYLKISSENKNFLWMIMDEVMWWYISGIEGSVCLKCYALICA
jgi:hypothetical protein